VTISCLLAKNANGENRDWGRGPLLQLSRNHELAVCSEFYYQCVKPLVTTDGELSYRLTDETIVRSQDDVMTLLRVGDGPDKTAQKHKSDPRFPCTKYMRS
jgi:hypothetical protein